MSQIMYNYPGMMATVGEMEGHNAGLQAIAEAIGSEQGILAGAWTGDSGMTYQAWQSQWNEAKAQLIASHRTLTNTHSDATASMLARDQAEGGKWA